MVWTSDNTSQPNDAERINSLQATIADLERRVSALEAGARGSNVAAASPYGSPEPAVPDAVDPWSVAPWPEIVSLILAGKKINAIKVYREYFSVGLKEAKDAVEEVERRVKG